MEIALSHESFSKWLSIGVNNMGGWGNLVEVIYTDSGGTQNSNVVDGLLTASWEYDGTNYYVELVMKIHEASIDTAFGNVSYPVEVVGIILHTYNTFDTVAGIEFIPSSGEITANNLQELKGALKEIRAKLRITYTNPIPLV